MYYMDINVNMDTNMDMDVGTLWASGASGCGPHYKKLLAGMAWRPWVCGKCMHGSQHARPYQKSAK